jgi:hypothetical protein
MQALAAARARAEEMCSRKIELKCATRSPGIRIEAPLTHPKARMCLHSSSANADFDPAIKGDFLFSAGRDATSAFVAY